MYINFHTHSEKKHDGVKAIQNIVIPDSNSIDAHFPDVNTEWASVGIHPWYINGINYQAQLKLFAEWAKNEQVKLIGECGLDRLCDTPVKFQQMVFEEQIRIAEELNKPVVIHCVKCFNELITIKRKLKPSVPFIIHGFNNNMSIARQLLESDCFFSFGIALFNPSSNASSFLKIVPLDRVFLENDDTSVDIKGVYEAASKLTNTTVNQLKDIIFANLMSLFNEGAQRPLK